MPRAPIRRYDRATARGPKPLIISHHHQFVFVHNPKCAGTTFRTHIGHLHDDATIFWDIVRDDHLGIPLDHAHLRLWELQLSHGPLLARLRHYRSVVFVRSPFTRLLSALVHHIRNYRQEFEFDGLDRAGRHRAFRQIIGELTIERIITDYRYVHFSPQLWFVALPGDDHPWTIVPISDDPQSILAGFDAIGLPHADPQPINAAPTSDASFLSDPAILLFTRDFYAADFALFDRLGLPDWLTALPPVGQLIMA